MNSKFTIRLAEPGDCEAILDIYKDYIIGTAITFETEIPSVAEFSQRISKILKCFPWLVCENDGHIIGYAYASKHRERAAYAWSVDFSVYIAPKYHRCRIATALYTCLIEILKLQGYQTACAAVTYPNEKSEAFHSFLEFKSIGVFENVGYKLGKWWDVQWFQRHLSEFSEAPKAILSIDDVKESKCFDKILKNSVSIIKRS
ncbi:MAG: N-acetyltransferase [Clostridia bacterium]|nr:N-acetyltransferase [Clostridia bacterium]